MRIRIIRRFSIFAFFCRKKYRSNYNPPSHVAGRKELRRFFQSCRTLNMLANIGKNIEYTFLHKNLLGRRCLSLEWELRNADECANVLERMRGSEEGSDHSGGSERRW